MRARVVLVVIAIVGALLTFGAGEARACGTPTTPPIAFISGQACIDSIWLIEADGSDPRRVTPDGPSISDLAWSPDGDHIVFSQGLGTSVDLWIVSTVTGDVRRLTTTSADEIHVSWSPDGGRIVFSRETHTGLELSILDLATMTETQLTSLGHNAVTPAWSPDGALIAFSSDHLGGSSIYVIAPDGTGLRAITDPVTTGYLAFSPAWSPSGTTLAFNTDSSQVYAIDLDGTNLSPVAVGGCSEQWSPSYAVGGSQILFTHTFGQTGPGLAFRNADGSGSITELGTRDPGTFWYRPVQSPRLPTTTTTTTVVTVEATPRFTC